jgi:DNA-binding MarR family transcriptional regulator
MPDTFLALTFKFKSLVFRAIREAGIDIVSMEIKSLHCINSVSQCTAANMVELMDRDKGQIGRLIKEMVVKGFIHKVPNPHDSRSQVIEFTKLGQEILNQMLAIEKDIIETMQTSLSSEQISQFNKIAMTMTQNLKTHLQ